ncbi:MAG: deoxyribonuclease IV [Thermoplasmatota archaeon]
MLVGAHVSTAGGAKMAPENGKRLGCEVLQIFSKNQQQWAAKPLDGENIEGYRSGVKANGFGPSLVHCSYLINMASSDDALWEKSVAGITDELNRAEQLGIPYIVFHPGSPKDKGSEWGCRRVGEGLTRALKATKGAKVMALIENNAGAGAAVGRTPEELGKMVDAVGDAERPRVGVCIDTCHTFVSGFPIHTPEGYDAFFAELDRRVGLARVRAFHLNDAKFPLGSNRDRHEHIGQGLMGEVVFARLLQDSRFKDHPGYLETPFEDDKDYLVDLATLRDLRSGKRKPKGPPKVGQMTLGGETAVVAPAKAKAQAGATKKGAKKK